MTRQVNADRVVRVSELFEQDVAQEQEIADARSRLESDSVERWSEANASLSARVEAARIVRAESEHEFDAASRDVALSAEGATHRQDKAHSVLTAARAELEKSERALDHCRKELELSQKAQQLAAWADYRDGRVKEFKAAQRSGCAALDKIEKALKDLREADHELREALGGIAVNWLYAKGYELSQGDPLADLSHAFAVIYPDELPIRWTVGQYDHIRRGQGDPHSPIHAVTPSFRGAFGHYFED